MRSRWLRRFILVGTICLAALATSQATGRAATAPTAGFNDWSCRPAAAHPDPVVLLHGLGGNMTDNFDTISPLLADNGYCVFALTYGVPPGATLPQNQFGGMVPMEQSSQQLATFVDRVLAATGAARIDMVGHSEGTVMPRYYLKFRGGAAKVDHFVALTPLYNGTSLYGVAALKSLADRYAPTIVSPIENLIASGCGSCQEFLTGSAFLANLNAGGPTVPGVTYTNIVTEYDEAVVPYTSGIIQAPNVTNIVLQQQCPTDGAEHVAVAFDPIAGQDILNALDPAHSVAPTCTVVFPFIGAPQAATS
jgi:triacylglycerol esterase/lipase EstA (alpha/beta hydrolase family)